MEYEVVFEVTEISRIHYYAGAGVFWGLFLAAWCSTMAIPRAYRGIEARGI